MLTADMEFGCLAAVAEAVVAEVERQNFDPLTFSIVNGYAFEIDSHGRRRVFARGPVTLGQNALTNITHVDEWTFILDTPVRVALDAIRQPATIFPAPRS